MFELLDNALKALAAYPPLAAFGSLVVFAGAIWLMMRGERDRKTNGHTNLPAWAVYGPVHDVMTSIHHLSEQSRTANQILERIEELLRDWVKDSAKEQRYQNQLLEFIRNNQEMRGDPQPPPNPKGSRRGL